MDAGSDKSKQDMLDESIHKMISKYRNLRTDKSRILYILEFINSTPVSEWQLLFPRFIEYIVKSVHKSLAYEDAGSDEDSDEEQYNRETGRGEVEKDMRKNEWRDLWENVSIQIIDLVLSYKIKNFPPAIHLAQSLALVYHQYGKNKQAKKLLIEATNSLGDRNKHGFDIRFCTIKRIAVGYKVKDFIGNRKKEIGSESEKKTEKATHKEKPKKSIPNMNDYKEKQMKEKRDSNIRFIIAEGETVYCHLHSLAKSLTLTLETQIQEHDPANDTRTLKKNRQQGLSGEDSKTKRELERIRNEAKETLANLVELTKGEQAPFNDFNTHYTRLIQKNDDQESRRKHKDEMYDPYVHDLY